MFLTLLTFVTILPNTVFTEPVEKITSILGAPFLMLKRDHTTYLGNEVFEGFSKDLADILSARLNFTYKLSLVQDNKYGRLTQGSWNGMVGELLEDGVADMAIAPLTMTSQRRSAVDFSTPFLEFQLAILLRKPGFGPSGKLLTNETPDTGNLFSRRHILRPASILLWSIVLAVLVSLILISYLIERVFKKKMQISKCVTTSGIALQFIFWIFIALFLGAYVGSFATYRIADILGRSSTDSLSDIRTISDLAAQERVQFGSLRSGSTFDYFRVSPDRTHRKIYSSMTRDKLTSLPGTIEEGVARVRYGIKQYAFIMESPYAAYETTLKPCNVIIASDYFGPKKAFAVATRPGYALRAQINAVVLTMKENGELDELEEKWMSGTNECESQTLQSTKVQHESLTLDLMTIFEILLIVPFALILSSFIAILEIIVARRK